MGLSRQRSNIFQNKVHDRVVGKFPTTRSGTSTGSEDFVFLICLDAIQFVLLSILNLVEAI